MRGSSTHDALASGACAEEPEALVLATVDGLAEGAWLLLSSQCHHCGLLPGGLVLAARLEGCAGDFGGGGGSHLHLPRACAAPGARLPGQRRTGRSRSCELQPPAPEDEVVSWLKECKSENGHKPSSGKDQARCCLGQKLSTLCCLRQGHRLLTSQAGRSGQKRRRAGVSDKTKHRARCCLRQGADVERALLSQTRGRRRARTAVPPDKHPGTADSVLLV
eukprot:1159797-Pelagomonas_calceolata.AAC.8